jgi:hypothetical protein
MTEKLNCWQFKNCGREKGGLLVEALGECPVPSAMKYDGMNDGVGAGRACWMVPDSGCQARHGQSHRCSQCEFYNRVVFEQEEQTLFRFVSHQAESA